jgi:hypothetical protein
MAERELKLNSLGRYGKNSSRLILEEHGHCEVPAGCGGVILRWRNPDSGLLFLVQLFALGKFEVWIDGVTPSSGRPLIAYGEHVLAVALDEIPPDCAVIAFSAVHDESDMRFPRVSQPSGRKESILSAPDGCWKYVTTKPIDTWLRSGFDDTQWRVMQACEVPALDQKQMPYFRLREILKTGAKCLTLDPPASKAWIRRTFRVQRTHD